MDPSGHITIIYINNLEKLMKMVSLAAIEFKKLEFFESYFYETPLRAKDL